MTIGKDYYWLAPGMEVVPVDDDGVLFQSDVVSLKLEGQSATFFAQTVLPLLDGARTLLAGAAPLVLYGPYQRGGVHTAPSNADFDASLRSRDPSTMT